MFVLCLTTLLVADVGLCLTTLLVADVCPYKGQTSATKRVVRQRTNICYQKSSQKKDKTSATKRVVRQRTNICYQKSSQVADICPLFDYSFGNRWFSFVWLLFWYQTFVLFLTTLLVADVYPLSDYSFNVCYQKSSQDKHLLPND
jgi:hypothetical protein